MTLFTSRKPLPPRPYIARRLEDIRRWTLPSSMRWILEEIRRRAALGCIQFVAMDDQNRVRAAASLVPQPGKTAMLFVARADETVLNVAIRCAVDACCTNAPAEKVQLVQCLINPMDTALFEGLKAAGFWRLADLAYMDLKTIRHAEPHPPTPSGITWAPGDDGSDVLLAQVLQGTYEQSADCPRLHGLRHIADVIAGHRGSGNIQSDLWTIARSGDEAVAVLLLNPIREMRCVELVYLGVVPGWRRRSLASALMQRAKWQCAQQGYRHMTLAVDADNTPALNLYRQYGFRITEQRGVMLRQITP